MHVFIIFRSIMARRLSVGFVVAIILLVGTLTLSFPLISESFKNSYSHFQAHSNIATLPYPPNDIIFSRVPPEQQKPYLKVHYLYDSTAKQALLNLTSWLHHQDEIRLPLFENRITEIASTKHFPNPRICVSVASKRREGSPIAYLVQGVSALLNRMQWAVHKDIVYIHVFNVDNEPEKHLEVDLIKHLVPVTNLKVPLEKNGDFPITPHYHESLDNAGILRNLHKIGCQYPILLEDDALATENWVESVLLAIEQLESRENTGLDWFVVKLFVARASYPTPITKGINGYNPTFNSVAFTINRKLMIHLAEALERMVSETVATKNHDAHLPIDLLLNRLHAEEGLPLEAFEPVVFQHTGVYSSLARTELDEKSATSWIMFSKYFESEGKPIIFDSKMWETGVPTVLQ